MQKYNTVEEYIDAQEFWREELVQLRKLCNSTRLVETVKWGAPCYTVNGKNVVGLGAFKNFVSIWFHQGALLSDPLKKLINAQEGKTKALRQWRVSKDEQLDEQVLLAYLEEAISNQEQGVEIKAPKSKPLNIPEELQRALNEKPDIAQTFEKLGLTKKREFADYIAEAKRPETKQKRIDKILPMILDGVGLHDKYK